METLGATVVITAYNQKQNLALCMEWLQGVSGITDIIIVDNGSTDGTPEMLAKIRGGGIVLLTKDSKVMERFGMPL